MAESNHLGAGDCPIKGCSGTASFSLSKRNLPVATCMVCKAQIFSRGEVSDELLRDLIDAKPKAPAPAPAAPTPAPKKIQVPFSETEKPPTPKPEPKRPSWGMLGA